MQCHLNGVQINEVPKFLAETQSEWTHTIELVNPFEAAHLLIIQLKLSGVISYFDVYSPNITEYEDEEIPKIHLAVVEPHSIYKWVFGTRNLNVRPSRTD